MIKTILKAVLAFVTDLAIFAAYIVALMIMFWLAVIHGPIVGLILACAFVGAIAFLALRAAYRMYKEEHE